jgi:hypothetical protein
MSVRPIIDAGPGLNFLSINKVLLARRLPALGALLRGTAPVPIATARTLTARALTAAGGNPATIGACDQDPAATTAQAPAPVYTDLIIRWTAEL